MLINIIFCFQFTANGPLGHLGVLVSGHPVKTAPEVEAELATIRLRQTEEWIVWEVKVIHKNVGSNVKVSHFLPKCSSAKVVTTLLNI